MSEKLVVINKTKQVLSLRIQSNLDEEQLKRIARHKERRVRKAAFKIVTLKPNTPLDLVRFLGFSVEEIKNNVVFADLFNKKAVSIVEEISDIEKEKDLVEKVEEIPKEDVLEDAAEEVDEDTEDLVEEIDGHVVSKKGRPKKKKIM
jgi:hypothetical protein